MLNRGGHILDSSTAPPARPSIVICRARSRLIRSSLCGPSGPKSLEQRPEHPPPRPLRVFGYLQHCQYHSTRCKGLMQLFLSRNSRHNGSVRHGSTGMRCLGLRQRLELPQPLCRPSVWEGCRAGACQPQLLCHKGRGSALCAAADPASGEVRKWTREVCRIYIGYLKG